MTPVEQEWYAAYPYLPEGCAVHVVHDSPANYGDKAPSWKLAYGGREVIFVYARAFEVRWFTDEPVAEMWARPGESPLHFGPTPWAACDPIVVAALRLWKLGLRRAVARETR